MGAEGHIICNTTKLREAGNTFPKYGGVSGAPLANISKERLILVQKHLGAERKKTASYLCWRSSQSRRSF